LASYILLHPLFYLPPPSFSLLFSISFPFLSFPSQSLVALLFAGLTS
jgi:hypothetical protein